MPYRLLPLLLVTLFVMSGCKKTDEPEDSLSVLWPAPKFTLTNQFGEPFGSDQTKGHTWIATLFFTTCPGPCPMMAARLQEIQQAVNDPNVLLVSISCDPQNDTVEKLFDYAKAHEADPKRWFFLTGRYDDVHQTATALKLGFDPATATTPISHSTKFLLIDKNNDVRGVYTHDDPESMRQLKVDAATLSREK